MSKFTIKNASDIQFKKTARGSYVRYSGNPAEIAGQIPAEEAEMFFKLLSEEMIDQIKKTESPCMLHSLCNKTWPKPMRTLKEEQEFSWSVFNGYILACKKMIYSDVNWEPAPLVL